MSRIFVSFILVFIDIITISVVPFLALFIRFDGNVEAFYYDKMLSYLPPVIFIRIMIFYAFGIYRRLWRYASINELLVIFCAVTLSSVIIAPYLYAINSGIPNSVQLISWVLSFIFVGGSRLAIRIFHYLRNRSHIKTRSNVLIVGAGDAGAMIAREINQRYCNTKKLVGFIDDSPYKQNQMLLGSKILGRREEIAQVALEHSIDEIIIAMPSVDGSIVREILNHCKSVKCQVKTLPGMYELIDGKVAVRQLRNVDLEDLLFREPIKLNQAEIIGYMRGKRVLVTGAGGSIGSELCRQIARMSPASLCLLGKGENSIYEIDRELREVYHELDITPTIADVRDGERIHTIFAQVKPQVVFHAAAHKHVPLMEAQPIEAVRNNIFGTKTVAEAANRFGTEVFVMISTDKAVNPTSVMGATKRVAELVIQRMNIVSDTKFVAVRFGNVLGSRGSVIPLFKKQIAQGGPITITHPDMQRYFMTIPEASQLVLQAGALAKGGEVFVLDMGKPIRIADMAADLIELSGLVPHKDIKIKYTGLRPGEKLFEELLTAEEGTAATKHDKIFVANLKAVDVENLQRCLLALQSTRQPEEVIKILSKLIPTYQNYLEKPCLANKEIKKSDAKKIVNEVITAAYQAEVGLH